MQKHNKEEIVRIVKYVLFSASAGLIQFITLRCSTNLQTCRIGPAIWSRWC